MATIQEVARAAGVSTATVSRVLSGRAEVSSELKERVRRAVRDLDYRPNAVARSLRRRGTTVWGVIIPDIGNPFFTALVRGIEDIAHEEGFSLVLCNSDENLAKERRYVEVALDEQMAGVIVSAASEGDSDLGPLLTRGVPVVAVDRRLERSEVDTVLVDNTSGAYLGARHLFETGCHRVACITGPTRTTTASERLEGYVRAVHEQGLQVDDDAVRRENFKEDGGYAGTVALLDSRNPPDGLFVTNNLMTVGAMSALAERGVKVPEDVALVGFDTIPWAALTRPRLTTVTQPTYQMGREAGRALATRIRGDAGPARTIVLTPTLEIRESSLRVP
jgi:LacI family transcriptional regulator, galactose operon repressor